jgi:hypothetical protein
MNSKAQRRPWDRRGLDALSGVVEKRRHQRLSTSISGHIRLGVSRIEVTTVDLSRSGALLRWNSTPDISLHVGDTLDLVLIWPLQASSCALDVEATVVRLEPDAIAVQFFHLVDEAEVQKASANH